MVLPQRYKSFTTPAPLPADSGLISGILGSAERWDGDLRLVRKLALDLRFLDTPGVHVETVGNHRRSRQSVPLISLAAVLAIPVRIHAQESPNSVPASEGKLSRREISIWGGGTFAHPHLIEDVQPEGGRRLDLFGMRFDQRLWSPGKVSLRGNFGVTPLAVFSRPAGSGRAYTYGGGISSGVELTTRNSWRVQPYGDAGVGCLIFTQPTPIAEARRFNFSFYFGPGFRIPRYRIRFGVWYHHFSNARTAPGNPALDSLIAYVGYSFFRRE